MKTPILVILLSLQLVACQLCLDGSSCIIDGDACQDGSTCTSVIDSPALSISPPSITDDSIPTPTEPVVETTPLDAPTSIIDDSTTVVEPTITDASSLETTEPSSTSSSEASSSETSTATDDDGAPEETAASAFIQRAERSYPEAEMNAEESVNNAAIELDSYVNAINGDVAPSVEDPERIVLPSCPDVQALAPRGLFDGKGPPKRPTFNCSPKQLNIDVHFKYVGYGLMVNVTRKAALKRRIEKQVSFSSSPVSFYKVEEEI